MFSTAKDKEEIANLKELLEGMLDEFDQSVATVKALINWRITVSSGLIQSDVVPGIAPAHQGGSRSRCGILHDS